MTSKEHLSQSDVEALSQSSDIGTKLQVVQKLCKQYVSEEFTESELKISEQIFRHLLKDTEIEVRKVLSASIVSSSIVPKDVVLSLAKDVETVACPVLEFSEVFNDNDLIEIIKETENAAHQMAIAKRVQVAASVSDALVEQGKEEVVGTLLHNAGAEISDDSYDKVVGDFSNNEKIIDSLIQRGNIKQKIMTKIATTISDKMKKRLEARYHTSFEEIHTLFQESGEIAAIKLMAQQDITSELMDLVDQLEENGTLEDEIKKEDGELARLLDSLGDGHVTAVPALAWGNLTLFVVIATNITGIKYPDILKLIENHQGTEALYKRGGLHHSMHDVVLLAIRVIQNLQGSDEVPEGEKIRHNLHVYIKHLTQEGQRKNVRNLAHFVSMVQQNIEKLHGGW